MFAVGGSSLYHWPSATALCAAPTAAALPTPARAVTRVGPVLLLLSADGTAVAAVDPAAPAVARFELALPQGLQGLGLFAANHRGYVTATAGSGSVAAVVIVDVLAKATETVHLPPDVASVATFGAAGGLVLAMADGTLRAWSFPRGAAPSALNDGDAAFAEQCDTAAVCPTRRGDVLAFASPKVGPGRGVCALNPRGALKTLAPLQPLPADLAPTAVPVALPAAAPTGVAVVCVQRGGPALLVSIVGEELTTTAVAAPGPIDDVCDAEAPEGFPEECALCFDTLEVGGGEGLTLDCGHGFHSDCVEGCMARAEQYLPKGHRVLFNMARCPSGCGTLIRHPAFGRSAAIADRYARIIADARPRAAVEYPGKPAEEVLDSFLYYVCSRCAQPYWGGNKDCAAMLSGEPDVDPAALVCDGCRTDFACPAHDRSHVVYKCIYCCNPATHFSLGRLRQCDRCVTEKRKEPLLPNAQCCGDACPFGGRHAVPAEGADVTAAPIPVGCLACMDPIDTDKVALADPQ